MEIINVLCQREGAEVTLYETKTKSQRNSTKRKSYSLIFGIAVAFKKYHMENGGGTVAPTEFFFAFSRQIRKFSII